MAIEKIEVGEPKEQSPEELHDFYDAYFNKEVRIKFNKLKVLNILRGLGFYRYDVPDSTQSEMVRIVDNKIHIVDEKMKEITDAFEDYIWKLPTIEREFIQKQTMEDGSVEMQPFKFKITATFLVQKMYDNLAQLFSPDLMARLRPMGYDIEIKQDEKHHKYVYFNNIALDITRDGIREMSYSELSGYIWENNIINRDYHEDPTQGDYETFIGDICNYNSDIKDEQLLYVGKERKKSLMSIIGYLLHNNFECNLKALLLTDVNSDNTGKPEGGTGKGLIGKALAQMLNRSDRDVCFINIPGKGFEFKDTRYAMGDLTTQLIHIEDLEAEKFDFQNLYNDVTDGCLFRKLHQNPTKHFAKLMLSTNRTIDISGASSKRRIVLFELYNYYNEYRTPETKFGRMFFKSDWTDRDWNQFYTFMVQCMYTYMRYGLLEPQMINYDNRQLEEVTNEDFVQFFGDAINNAVVKMVRTEFVKDELHKLFKEKYPDFAGLSRKGFTTMCTRYLELKHIPSAACRKSSNSDGDILVLYPNIPECYKKVKYIVK